LRGNAPRAEAARPSCDSRVRRADAPGMAIALRLVRPARAAADWQRGFTTRRRVSLSASVDRRVRDARRARENTSTVRFRAGGRPAHARQRLSLYGDARLIKGENDRVHAFLTSRRARLSRAG